MTQVSKDEVHAAVSVVVVLGQTIRELGRVPSGELYAQCMGTLSLVSYQRALGVLVQAGLVREENHLLSWVGPA
jgi:hypothetical protein